MMQRLLRRRTETGDFARTQQKGKAAASRFAEAPPGSETKGAAVQGGGDNPRMPRILRALNPGAFAASRPSTTSRRW